MKKVGKGNISATVIKDSTTIYGDRITTFELEYPRFIHSELMTHRMFSRNAMSSRAVPVSKMLDQVLLDPATPIHWGKSQSGMQAEEEIEGDTPKELWKIAAHDAYMNAVNFEAIGVHKQVTNRILEPFQMMKTIVTATEYDNFFELRCHSDAQPEIKELADLMSKGMVESLPQLLVKDMWHVPYVETRICPDKGNVVYYLDDGNNTELTQEEALMVSSSCCAQVSYRLLDNSVEKAINIYNKLIKSTPMHCSPFEHCAKVMCAPDLHVCGEMGLPTFYEEGITHVDVYGNLWSGNFKGWIQYRQLL